MARTNKSTAESVFTKISNNMSKGMSFIDAALYYCDENGLAPEDIGNIIKRDSLMMQLITDEAIDAKLVDIEKEANLDDFIE